MLFQESGYGSGDDIYDDTETQVKKVLEEREYTMVSDSYPRSLIQYSFVSK